MISELFFADTFYWTALTNRSDEFPRDVLRFSATLPPHSVVTIDEVLTEFLAFCAHNVRLREQAGSAVEQLLTDPDIRVIPQTRRSFIDGVELYKARPDKGYSLTDCISMQTMRRENLTRVLTNDRHFEREGFLALFRS